MLINKCKNISKCRHITRIKAYFKAPLSTCDNNVPVYSCSNLCSALSLCVTLSRSTNNFPFISYSKIELKIEHEYIPKQPSIKTQTSNLINSYSVLRTTADDTKRTTNYVHMYSIQAYIKAQRQFNNGSNRQQL